MSFPNHPTIMFCMPIDPITYSLEPSYHGPPYTASNLGVLANTIIDRYMMHRETWFIPDGGIIEGVPRRYHIDGGVSVVGYRCDNCKRFFIAADLLDFEHGCTEEDYKP